MSFKAFKPKQCFFSVKKKTQVKYYTNFNLEKIQKNLYNFNLHNLCLKVLAVQNQPSLYRYTKIRKYKRI